MLNRLSSFVCVHRTVLEIIYYIWKSYIIYIWIVCALLGSASTFCRVRAPIGGTNMPLVSTGTGA